MRARLKVVAMALASLRAFRGLQEERVGLYRYFEEGFLAYLKAAPNLSFDAYKRLVHEISQEFKRISQLILCEKDALKTVHGRTDLSTLIDKVQEEESAKLEMTAAFQIARQTLVERELTTTLTTTATTTEDKERDIEMTKREISELKQKMSENETKIIELLEELKYESEDLYDEEEDENMEERTEVHGKVEGLEAADVAIEMEDVSR